MNDAELTDFRVHVVSTVSGKLSNPGFKLGLSLELFGKIVDCLTLSLDIEDVSVDLSDLALMPVNSCLVYLKVQLRKLHTRGSWDIS